MTSSIHPGSLFGRLTVEQPAEIFDGMEKRPGWVCRCSCSSKQRTFRTEKELLKRKNQSCGCDPKTRPALKVFSKPSDLYTVTEVKPIETMQEASERVGERWGSLTILGVHSFSRILVACSTCRTVTCRYFSEWGVKQCKCHSDEYVALCGQYVGKRFGKIEVKALAYEPVGKTIHGRWSVDCVCDCGSSFGIYASTFPKYLKRFPTGVATCLGCFYESEHKWTRAETWRKTHGGRVADRPAKPERLISKSGDWKIIHVRGSRGAVRKQETLAPKGLQGEAVTRYLLTEIWTGIQAYEVCPAWQDKEKFIYWSRHAGYVPGAHLMRKSHDEPYHPLNCIWAADRSKPSNERYRPEGKPEYARFN